MNITKNVLGVVTALAMSGLVACAPVEDSGSDSVTSTNEEGNDSTSGGESNGDKDKAKAKPGNVVGNWKLLNKPKIKKEFGMFGTTDLRVENISDSEDEPWLEIRLTKGRNLVTTFDCVGQTVRPGERTVLECTSFDDYRPWTKMEIKNAF